MGTRQVVESDPKWVEESITLYWRLLGNEQSPQLEGIPLNEGFEVARLALHAREGLALPCELRFPEARLEWGGFRVEGSVEPEGILGVFRPAEQTDDLPPPGAEVRLRHANGSLRVWALFNRGTETVLMRSAGRRERRMQTRKHVGGIAIVRMARGEENAAINDLSEGGAGLSAPFAVEVGDSVHLVMRIEGKKSLPLECDGIVTSCVKMEPGSDGKYRVGVRFVDLPDSLLEEIKRTMRRD